MPNDILSASSFRSLSDEDQARVKAVCGHYLKNLNLLNSELNSSTHYLGHDAANINFELSAREKNLNHITSAKFKHVDMGMDIHMDATRKKHELENLYLIFYKLSAKYQSDILTDRRQNLEKYAENISKCAELIGILNNTNLSFTFEHAKVISLTQTSTGIIGAFNTERQSIGWSKTLFGELLNSKFSAAWAQTSSAQAFLGKMSNVTGHISYGVYGVRLGVNVGLILKHYQAYRDEPPGAKKDALKKIYRSQIEQRKFEILNDVIWSTVNTATFFALKNNITIGATTLGSAGGMVTAAFMLVDTLIVYMRYLEASKAHEQEILKIDNNIKLLEGKLLLIDINTDLDLDVDLNIRLDIEALKLKKAQCELDWKYKKYSFMNEGSYALLLFISFTIMAIVAASLAAAALPGAIICFALNTLSAVVASVIEIAKAEAQIKVAQERSESCISKGDHESYLIWEQAQAEIEHQEKLKDFYKEKAVVSMTAALLVPALACAALLIAIPGVNIALGVLAIVIAVAYIAYQFYKKNNEPEMTKDIYINDRYSMFKSKHHEAQENRSEIEPLADNNRITDDSDAEDSHAGHYYDIDDNDSDLLDDHDILPAA